MTSLFFKHQKQQIFSADSSTNQNPAGTSDTKLKYPYQRMKQNMQRRNGGSLWPLNENREFAFRQQPSIQNTRPIIHKLLIPKAQQQQQKFAGGPSDTHHSLGMGGQRASYRSSGSNMSASLQVKEQLSNSRRRQGSRNVDRPKYISVNQLRETLMSRPRREIESAFYNFENAQYSTVPIFQPQNSAHYQIGAGEIGAKMVSAFDSFHEDRGANDILTVQTIQQLNEEGLASNKLTQHDIRSQKHRVISSGAPNSNKNKIDKILEYEIFSGEQQSQLTDSERHLNFQSYKNQLNLPNYPPQSAMRPAKGLNAGQISGAVDVMNKQNTQNVMLNQQLSKQTAIKQYMHINQALSPPERVQRQQYQQVDLLSGTHGTLQGPGTSLTPQLSHDTSNGITFENNNTTTALIKMQPQSVTQLLSSKSLNESRIHDRLADQRTPPPDQKIQPGGTTGGTSPPESNELVVMGKEKWQVQGATGTASVGIESVMDPRITQSKGRNAGGLEERNFSDFDQRINMPSINQGIFTNQAIMENQANFERDNFLHKLQRSDQDIQLERLRGEKLLLEKRTARNAELTATVGVKTNEYIEDENSSNDENDTKELDLTSTPTKKKRSKNKSSEMANIYIRKSKPTTNRISKIKRKTKDLKKQKPANKSTTIRSSKPEKDTLGIAETQNTIPMETEDITSLEIGLSQQPHIPNVFSPGTSIQQPENTFSLINSDKPIDLLNHSQLPKNQRDAVHVSSQLQQRYGERSQFLNKRVQNEFHVKNLRVKKQLKVDENDRQKMIIESTLGKLSPILQLQPRTAATNQQQLTGPQFTQASSAPRSALIKGSVKCDVSNDNGQAGEGNTRHFDLMRSRSTVAKFVSAGARGRGGSSGLNNLSSINQQTRTQGPFRSSKLGLHRKSMASPKSQLPRELVAGSGPVTANEEMLIFNEMSQNNGFPKPNLEPSGSAHKSRRSLARAVKLNKEQKSQSLSSQGVPVGPQSAGRLNKMSKQLAQAQFKIENHNLVRKVAEDCTQLATTETSLKQGKQTIVSKMQYSSLDMIEQIENQRVFLAEKGAISITGMFGKTTTNLQHQSLTADPHKLSRIPVSLIGLGDRQSKFLKKRPNHRNNQMRTPAFTVDIGAITSSKQAQPWQQFEFTPAHEVLDDGGDRIEHTMLDNFATNSTISQKNQTPNPDNNHSNQPLVQETIGTEGGKAVINYQDQAQKGREDDKIDFAGNQTVSGRVSTEGDGRLGEDKIDNFERDQKEQISQNLHKDQSQNQQYDTQKIEVIDEKDSNIQSIVKNKTIEQYHTDNDDLVDPLDFSDSKQTVAQTIEQRISELLDKTVLTEMDMLTEDELIKMRYERMNEVYANIQRNHRQYGYAKSPDFQFKSEMLQRQKERAWLESRGKTPEGQKEKVLLRNNLDFVKVVPSAQKYNSIMHKNDFECVYDQQMEKNNNQSMDYNNQEIITFCTYLFQTWLEDYREYAQLMMKRNLTYHHYSLNQAVEQNIKDNCLPIDYFIERMLQVGICSTMRFMRQFIEIMLTFDNAGFVPCGPDIMHEFIGEDEIQVSRTQQGASSAASPKDDQRKSLTREEFDKVPWDQPFQNQFVPMNYPSKETQRFLRRQLHNKQFEITDRISLNQFLSLFNVIGVENAKKLDKLTIFLKKEASKFRNDQYFKEKQKQKLEEKKKKQLSKMQNSVAKDYEIQRIKQSIRDDLVERRDNFMKGLREKVTPMQRKISGILIENIVKQTLMKRQLEQHNDDKKNKCSDKINLRNQTSKNQCNEDEQYYQMVIHEFKKVSSSLDYFKDYQKHLQSQGANGIQVEDVQRDKQHFQGSLISPAFIINSIKGDNQDVVIRKQANLIKLFYDSPNFPSNSTRIPFKESQLAWQAFDNQIAEKGIFGGGTTSGVITGMRYVQPENMPNIIEEDHNFSRSRSSLEETHRGAGESDKLAEEMVYYNTVGAGATDDTAGKEQRSSLDRLTNELKCTKVDNGTPIEHMSQRKKNQLCQRHHELLQTSIRNVSQYDCLRTQNNKLNPKNRFVKKYSIDNDTIMKLRRELEQGDNTSQKSMFEQGFDQDLIKSQQQLDIIRKQMILQEICKDLKKVQAIIAGMIEFDSVNYIEKKFDRAVIFSEGLQAYNGKQVNHSNTQNNQKVNEKAGNNSPEKHGQINKSSSLMRQQKSRVVKIQNENQKLTVGSTLTRNEALRKRQHYRKQFFEFIMVGLREKYSKQMGLLYNNDEQKIGKNIYKGASMDMMRDPKDYGIQARTHLLKIASLMVRHNIQLTNENYIDPCHMPRSDKDKPRGKAQGILGWIIDLCQVDEIRNQLNMLINLVLEQIHDRDDTMSFPNEEIEQLIKQGEDQWNNKIDPINELAVPRRCIDSFLCSNKICSDYKQVNRFLSGVLSNITIRIQDDFKKTHFMKIIYKAALRESIRNMMTYNKFGYDSDFITLIHGRKPQALIPFSLRVQRFQRYILYSGIKTKNSKQIPIQNRKDYLERSEACSSIVTHLQDMKQNKNLINADSCKIELETLVTEYKKNKKRILKEAGILNDLQNTSEWDSYVASNPDKLALFESFDRFQAIFNKNQPEHLAQLQADAYKKSVYKSILDESQQNHDKQIKIHEGSIFSPKHDTKYLPQVKQALRIRSNNQDGEVAKLIHNQKNTKLNHNLNRFIFGEPDSFLIARGKQKFSTKSNIQQILTNKSSKECLDPLEEFNTDENSIQKLQNLYQTSTTSKKDHRAAGTAFITSEDHPSNPKTLKIPYNQLSGADRVLKIEDAGEEMVLGGKSEIRSSVDADLRKDNILKEEYEKIVSNLEEDRVSLVDRQNLRSMITREMNKKAINMYQKQ